MSDVIEHPIEVLPDIVPRNKPQKPPLYQVFLSHSGERNINLDGTFNVPFDSYIILREVFQKSDSDAEGHLREVHEKGCSVVLETTREVAESKTTQANNRARSYEVKNSDMRFVKYYYQQSL